jgi:TatD DNase family protein
MKLFDSHAHYDDKKFAEDRHAVLAALPKAGISGVMNAASDLDSAEFGIKLAEKYDYVWASAGIHPHEAKDASKDYIERLAALLSKPKVQALGEIGLDYHYDFSPRETQLAVFERQLELAMELDMPVIIHDREAHAETLRLLKKHRPRGVVHCYSGSAEMVTELLKLGLYIGFTGVITFANARKTVEAASAVPLERLLIETDCPYMAPTPFRGKRCDSTMIGKTCEALSDIKGVSTEELAEITDTNARVLYNIREG